MVNTVQQIERGKLLENIENELFGLKESEISNVIEENTRFHIIQCNKIHSSHLQSFESAAYEIRERLHYVLYGLQEKQILQQMKNRADIKIFHY